MIINTDFNKLRFKGEHDVYENIIHISVLPDEFNLSYNPTLLEDSNNPFSDLKEFTKDPNFKPYVTTVGLYNDQNELLMVARLTQPIPLPPNTDFNILIKYDI